MSNYCTNTLTVQSAQRGQLETIKRMNEERCDDEGYMQYEHGWLKWWSIVIREGEDQLFELTMEGEGRIGAFPLAGEISAAHPGLRILIQVSNEEGDYEQWEVIDSRCRLLNDAFSFVFRDAGFGIGLCRVKDGRDVTRGERLAIVERIMDEWDGDGVGEEELLPPGIESRRRVVMEDFESNEHRIQMKTQEELALVSEGHSHASAGAGQDDEQPAVT